MMLNEVNSISVVWFRRLTRLTVLLGIIVLGHAQGIQTGQIAKTTTRKFERPFCLDRNVPKPLLTDQSLGLCCLTGGRSSCKERLTGPLFSNRGSRSLHCGVWAGELGQGDLYTDVTIQRDEWNERIWDHVCLTKAFIDMAVSGKFFKIPLSSVTKVAQSCCATATYSQS